MKLNDEIVHTTHGYTIFNSLLNDHQATTLCTLDGTFFDDTGKFTFGFARGYKDEWYVDVKKNNTPLKICDHHLFVFLQRMNAKYGGIYNDIFTIYTMVKPDEFDAACFTTCYQLVKKYPRRKQLNLLVCYVYVYLAMIAEWHYVHAQWGYRTRIGAGVKLIGLHQVLCDKMSPYVAARWSYGKSARAVLIPKLKNILNESEAIDNA